MDMKKIMLFPYHPDMWLLVEQISELENTSIAGFASYREDDIVIRRLNERLGSSSNIEEIFKICDYILFLDDYRKCKKEKYYELLEKAIAAGKKAVFVPQLKKKLDLKTYEGKYCFLQDEIKIDMKKHFLKEKTKYPVEIPVVTVMGTGKNCNKFENQILLKKMIEEKGYNVVWISSNPLGALFGGNTMPQVLFEDTVSFEEKIFWFNHFMYGLSRERMADLCIIGIPEGIAEFEKYEYNHFAEYALIIGNAVSVDSSVLCTYLLSEPVWNEMEKIIQYIHEKFNFPVDVVSIGNTGYQLLEDELDVIYMFFKKDYARKRFVRTEDLPDCIAGIWEKERLKLAMEKILEHLCTNVVTV